MFDTDLTTLPTADLLESAAAHRAEANRVEARLLEHAQVFADRYHPSACPRRPGRRSWDGRERGIVLGGDGCPEVAEFAPAEFGVMLGISSPAAAAYIGQALALRHRFPRIWAAVQAGDATPWRARRVATACEELTEEAAASVDKRLARIVDTVTPHRLENIVKAAAADADPQGARQNAEQKARERGVYVCRSDEHGTKKIFIRAACGNVIRFDATIASIAEALKVFGDSRSLQARRAEAIGIIADPRYTEELLLQAREQLLDAAAPALPSNAGPGATPAAASVSDLEHPADGEGRACRAAGRKAPSDDELLNEWTSEQDEPGPDDEADRDAPHPSDITYPDAVDDPPVEPFDPGPGIDPDDGESLDAASQRALYARLARIKHEAHTAPTLRSGADHLSSRLRPGMTEIYVHLTDHTLANGDGVLRAEGIGPLLATQLAELVGHGPYALKPVIDLNDAVSVDAYEIPGRIRERVKLTHPVELFPYGSCETRRTMDLDHIQPYDPLGPPGQTSTGNLAPLGRFGHRVKTHGHGWKVHRIDPETLEWTTPNGFSFHVTPTGTRRVRSSPRDVS